MNNANLLGRLTKDPVVRYAGDLPIADFTLAIDRVPNKNGEKNTDFISCKAFGNTAITIEKYVRKGYQLGLSGEIQTSSYENSEGKRIFRTDVVAKRVTLITQKKDDDASYNEDLPSGWEQINDDDIPF